MLEIGLDQSDQKIVWNNVAWKSYALCGNMFRVFVFRRVLMGGDRGRFVGESGMVLRTFVEVGEALRDILRKGAKDV